MHFASASPMSWNGFSYSPRQESYFTEASSAHSGLGPSNNNLARQSIISQSTTAFSEPVTSQQGQARRSSVMSSESGQSWNSQWPASPTPVRYIPRPPSSTAGPVATPSIQRSGSDQEGRPSIMAGSSPFGSTLRLLSPSDYLS